MDGEEAVMHGHKGIKASKLIAKLQKLIEKHGDLRVVAACDCEPIGIVRFESESWIGGAIGEDSPAFELDQWF